jgi:hypothetical protein
MILGSVGRLAALGAVVLAGCAASPTPTVAPPAIATPRSATASATGAIASPDASIPGSTGAAASAELAVECTATGTAVATDTVAVQLDGVHFRVRSAADGRAFAVDGVGGDNAPFPTGSLIFAVPPGDIRIWCGPKEPTDADWVAIHVVDPGGLYAADQLSCASGTHGSIDYAEGARGQPGDPIAVARSQLQGMRPADIVESAGYPATAVRKVRVIRDSEIIAVGTYQPDGQGGWLLGGVETCSDAGIQWGT